MIQKGVKIEKDAAKIGWIESVFGAGSGERVDSNSIKSVEENLRRCIDSFIQIYGDSLRERVVESNVPEFSGARVRIIIMYKVIFRRGFGFEKIKKLKSFKTIVLIL